MAETADVPWLQPYLVEFLQHQHTPCPACRCDLHAVTTPSCPACGVSITLGLASVEIYRVAWGILLGVLFVDAAVGIFFAVLLLRIPPGALHSSLWPAFIMFIASIPLPVFPLLFRRRFFRLQILVQSALAALGITWTLGAFLALWRGLEH